MFTFPAETAARAVERQRLSHTHFATSLFVRVMTWQEVARQRRRLATLDERLLADIGVSRVEAKREAAKAFWH